MALCFNLFLRQQFFVLVDDAPRCPHQFHDSLITTRSNMIRPVKPLRQCSARVITNTSFCPHGLATGERFKRCPQTYRRPYVCCLLADIQRLTNRQTHSRTKKAKNIMHPHLVAFQTTSDARRSSSRTLIMTSAHNRPISPRSSRVLSPMSMATLSPA
jgi:hypothetical protein